MAADQRQGEIVCVVDDDEVIRDVLSAVFDANGFSVETFDSGDRFLASSPSFTPACVLLDVLMPGRSGLDVLKELNGRGGGAPVIMISGSADIPMAVDAIKHGALDFIEKPFDPETIVRRVEAALDATGARAAARAQIDRTGEIPGSENLTPREREVLSLISGGQSNKEAGRQLGISPRTIEVHRARIMEKLGARNAADLVRIVLSATEGKNGGAASAQG
ncbi:response regulator transcription factor [Chenggangzhangella methanolivorans]|uniref:Response regulator n=1 Tax=Chenggangzhangella methanolivorans TaxID=1437009 RepID=A0A9E6UGF2_9HYPH|nr:response regulator [Chenggangzhangella methanolivorans]QZN98667.1 response regulator [Chenggangzhangella methanolivorans]